jgi:hypothetical protein
MLAVLSFMGRAKKQSKVRNGGYFKFLKESASTMRDVYVVFSCDAHKSRNSMRLIGITTGLPKLRSSVKTLIKNKVVTADEPFRVKDEWPIDKMNNSIEGLFIHKGYDGEFELNGSILT